jgi:hypothetical protein
MFLFDSLVHYKLVLYVCVLCVQFVDLTKAALNVHVYQLNECGPITEELDEEEEVTASQHWVLPCCQLPQRDVLRR